MENRLLAKDPKYKIYLIDIDSENYISIQMKNNNTFKYFQFAKYLIDFNYDGVWFSIEVDTLNHSPKDFIKYFHTIICIELRKQLIKRGRDGMVEFKKIPFALSYTFLNKL